MPIVTWTEGELDVLEKALDIVEVALANLEMEDPTHKDVERLGDAANALNEIIELPIG